jgi:peroxiredoxin Q/BCP
MTRWLPLLSLLACQAATKDPEPADTGRRTTGGSDAEETGQEPALDSGGTGPTDTASTPPTDTGGGTTPAPPLFGVPPGKPVPAPPPFVAFNLDGSERGLDDLVGRPTAVFFFPAPDTPGCTAEACAYRDLYADFAALGVEVLGVTFRSPEESAPWAESQALPYEVWSDRDRTLGLYYRVASGPTDPAPDRVSFLLDASGAVLLIYPGVDPGEHPAEVLADCEQLFGD